MLYLLANGKWVGGGGLHAGVHSGSGSLPFTCIPSASAFSSALGTSSACCFQQLSISLQLMSPLASRLPLHLTNGLLPFVQAFPSAMELDALSGWELPQDPHSPSRLAWFLRASSVAIPPAQTALSLVLMWLSFSLGLCTCHCHSPSVAPATTVTLRLT